MQLFYDPNVDEITQKIAFPAEESKHIVKVLRKKEGDILHITNGKGFLFEAKILVPAIRKCTAQIIKHTYQKKKAPYLHLAVAPTKMNDRYEWFIEKATEIGVSEITPIICDHSERKILKLDRMQKVLQSAMKQSLQYHLPILNEAIAYKEFMQLNISANLYIAHCEASQKVEFKTLLKPNQDALILIGPEGDFSVNEIHIAFEKGFSAVALGNNRLRTETAAIFAASCFALGNT